MSSVDNKSAAPPNAEPPKKASAEPKYAPPTPLTPTEGMTRRQAVRSAMFGTIGLFFGQVALGSGIMFWPIHIRGFGAPVPAGKVSDLPIGGVVKFPEGKFYLTRPDANHIIALYWKCVHLGCTVPWIAGESLFHCPCHGSMYNIYGKNVGGPAPRPLDYMEVKVKDDVITVNTGKISKRQTYEPSQLTSV